MWKEMSAAFKGLILKHHLISCCFFFFFRASKYKADFQNWIQANESLWVDIWFSSTADSFWCIWREFSQFWLNDSEQASLFWKDMTSGMFFSPFFFPLKLFHFLPTILKTFLLAFYLCDIPHSFQPPIHFVTARVIFKIYFLLTTWQSPPFILLPLHTICHFYLPSLSSSRLELRQSPCERPLLHSIYY